MDTRATDFRDGIVVPNAESDDDEEEEGLVSQEDDELVGDRNTNMIAYGLRKGKKRNKFSREVLIKMRRQQEREFETKLQKMEQMY